MTAKKRKIGRSPSFSIAEYIQARNSYFGEVKTVKKERRNSSLEKEDPQSIFKAMEYTSP